jgi:flagellin
MSNTLARMRELAVQSASDSNGVTQNALLDTEFQALNSELTRLRASTSFNGIDVFSSSAFSFQIASGTSNNSVTLAATPLTITQNVAGQTIQAGTVTNTTYAAGTDKPGLAIVNAMNTAAVASGATLASVLTATTTAVSAAVTAGELDAAAQTVVNDQLTAIKNAYAATTQQNGTTVKPAGSVTQMVADFAKVLGSVTAGVYSPSASVAGSTIIGQTIAQDITYALSTPVAALDVAVSGVKPGLTIINAMYTESSDGAATLASVLTATTDAVTADVTLSAGEKSSINAQLTAIKTAYAATTMTNGSPKTAGTIAEMLVDFVKVVGTGDTTDGSATTYTASAETAGTITITQAAETVTNTWTLAIEGDLNVVPTTVSTTTTTTGTASVNSLAAITALDGAITEINTAAASNGAFQNRMGITISNLSTLIETTTAARSRIMDTDFAAQTAQLSKYQILQQAGTAMLAQANQMGSNVLTLLK